MKSNVGGKEFLEIALFLIPYLGGLLYMLLVLARTYWIVILAITLFFTFVWSRVLKMYKTLLFDKLK